MPRFCCYVTQKHNTTESVLDSRLRRNFNLKQLYLSNQIRYRGDLSGIRNILKSSYSHKNFIIFGRVYLNGHWDKSRLLWKTEPKNKIYQPNYSFINSNLIFLIMELADMPTRFQHTLQKFNSHINIIIIN